MDVVAGAYSSLLRAMAKCPTDALGQPAVSVVVVEPYAALLGTYGRIFDRKELRLGRASAAERETR